jgi:hypothetical protein
VESAHGTKILEVRNREDILPSNLYTHPCGKKNFWSNVGEDPRIDPALAAAIDQTLSLLPRHIPEKIDDPT